MSEVDEPLQQAKENFCNGEAVSPADRLSVLPFAAPSARSACQQKPYTFLSEITTKPIEWVWSGRIPSGELTMIDGDPDTNKSSLTLDLAARISTGRSLPFAEEEDKPADPGKVLLLVAEDSIEKTLPSRLQAAGADLAKVAVVNQALILPQDLGVLRAAIVQTGAKLVVLDPLVVFLGVCNTRDQSVRQALMPVVKLAAQTNTAIVGIRHLVKTGGRHRLYRGSGSIAIIGAARSGFLVANSPDDANMRVLCHSKCNLGAKTPSLLFEPVGTSNGSFKIEWRGECEYTTEDLLGPANPAGNKVAKAEEFLLDLLADGPMEQRLIQQEAAEALIAYRTVERAKSNLGIVSERMGFGDQGLFLWRLPEDDAAEAP